jgi:hypothetical protein
MAGVADRQLKRHANAVALALPGAGPARAGRPDDHSGPACSFRPRQPPMPIIR